MESSSANTSPLKSEFADDADMAELLDLFIADLGSRIASLQDGLAHHRVADLRTLAHQLKGSAGGYGYPDLSRAAATLESRLDADPTSITSASLVHSVQSLVDICRRAIAGHHPQT